MKFFALLAALGLVLSTLADVSSFFILHPETLMERFWFLPLAASVNAHVPPHFRMDRRAGFDGGVYSAGDGRFSSGVELGVLSRLLHFGRDDSRNHSATPGIGPLPRLRRTRFLPLIDGYALFIRYTWSCFYRSCILSA